MIARPDDNLTCLNTRNLCVGVITRTKNRPFLLQRAMESVLDQKHENWVHVIINDGGASAPIEALQALYRARYRGRLIVIHNPESLGMEAASNIGIQAVKCDYLVIHDDDDTWEREFLQKSLATLLEQKAVVPATRGVMCYATVIKERLDGETITIESHHSFNNWIQTVSLAEMLSENLFPPICFLFERAVIEEIGYFNEKLPVLGDWEFNLRFLSHFEIAVLKEHLANYHQRPSAKNIYGNSVHHGVDKHILFGTVLRNELLRRDIEDGKPGIGFLVNFAQQLSPVRELGRIIRRLRQNILMRTCKPFLKRLFP